MTVSTGDWMQGEAAILYQSCTACGRRWYFRREFCPGCGAPEPATRRSCGRGTVYACSLVSRPPAAEMRALAPYAVILVDMEEGFRMMAHGEPSLRIGDRVNATFRDFAGRLLPCFSV